MYCTVFTNGNGNVIYINPNCNMKLIYEYLRVVTEVPDSKEIDLCTENGRLLGIYEAPCSASGLQYFKPRSNYFVLTFDYAESSGDLYNPQSMMHYTNRDFEAVFARIKKAFGILSTEPVDDSDALLIFEHLLLAYQEKRQLFSESNVSSPSKRSDKKKRSHSANSVKAKGSKSALELSVLIQWREEKRLKMAASRTEESDFSMMRRKSSAVRTSVENEHAIDETFVHESDEATLEEQPFERFDLNKSKELKKIASHTTGKKGFKKQNKKSGKDAKEDAQLQKAAPSKSGIFLSPKHSFRTLFSESALQLPPSNVGSGDNLISLYASKSSLFAKSEFHDSNEPTQRRPYDSIRQFFKDHPIDTTDLPKPPVPDSNADISEKPKKTAVKKKLGVGKRRKIAISCRRGPTKIRKRLMRK